MLWNDILSKEDRALAKSLATRAQLRREECTVYPSQENIFRALTLTPPDKVKCVIIGQDPYINPGQAEGLCFSVAAPTPPPPSLQNIFKELVDDLGVPMPTTGSLVKWAEEGVLLLNSTLSVDAGHSNSHKDWGWDVFTGHVLEATAQLPQPIVYIAWGADAQCIAKRLPLGENKALITAPHPSPLSAYRGFFGSKPFSQANEQLVRIGGTPIDWQLP